VQGLFVNDRHPSSKKAVKEAVKNSPDTIVAYATSLWGNEFNGRISHLLEGQQVHFVGPDPYRLRKFYGTISRKNGKLKVV
jgi:hypothetical protein